VGPGLAGALGSLFKVGGMNRGQQRRGKRGARMDGVKSGVKKNAVELRLGYGRGSLSRTASRRLGRCQGRDVM
jgi:hypothetical protein